MFKSYHAHIYYDPATRRTAAKVRGQIEERFTVKMGSWHDEPVGPHPQSMYQVAFSPGVFPKIVPWLMENRAGLAVLVHPNSGDDLLDHSDYAIWLGRMLRLKLGMFKTPRG